MTQQRCSTYTLIWSALTVVLFGVVLAHPTPVQALTTVRPTVSFDSARVHRLTFDCTVRADRAALHKGVKEYVVTYDTSDTFDSPLSLTVPGSDKEFTLIELQSGTQYYIQVVTHYNDGEESWTVESDGWTKPNRPRFLKVRNLTSTSAQFKWQLPYRTSWYTRNLVHWYKVYDTPVLEGEKTNSTQATQRTYELVGEQYIYIYNRNWLYVYNLEPGQKYAYRIKANIFNYTTSNWSDYKHFTTPTETTE